MLSWKRTIVGDAFRVPSRNINFYRDIVLAWPFLLFSIAALANLLSRTSDHRPGFEFAALSLASILLAKERLPLVVGALGFCFAQSTITSFLRHSGVGLLVAIITGASFVVLVRRFKNYKPSYERPAGTTVELLIGLSSLGLTLLLFHWIVG